MKRLNNNLPPESQQWVREVENILGELERQNVTLQEANRQQSVILNSITMANTALREQQAKISEGLVVGSERHIITVPTTPFPAEHFYDTVRPLTVPTWAATLEVSLFSTPNMTPLMGSTTAILSLLYSGGAVVDNLSRNVGVSSVTTDINGPTRNLSTVVSADYLRGLSDLQVLCSSISTCDAPINIDNRFTYILKWS